VVEARLIEELKDFDDDHPIFDVLIIDETSRLKDRAASALVRS
jgi:hypothetical protein